MPVHYQLHPPTPLLRPFVRYYLNLHMGGNAGGIKQYVLPAKTEEGIFINTGAEAAISLLGKREDDISGNPYCCKLRGAVAEASLRIHLQSELEMFVIAYHPGALHRYFGMPATDIANAYTPAQWVLGTEWEEMGMRIRETQSFAERVQIAENQLLRHFPGNDRQPGSIDLLITQLQKGRMLRVDEMAKSVFLSERQFRRRFMEKVGISASRFASICRLQQVIQTRQKNPAQSWRSLAFEWGYSDQSHLLKDLKNLLGMPGFSQANPQQFLHVEGSNYRLLQEARLERMAGTEQIAKGHRI